LFILHQFFVFLSALNQKQISVFQGSEDLEELFWVGEWEGVLVFAIVQDLLQALLVHVIAKFEVQKLIRVVSLAL
jgi:hypothetical protein